MDFERFLTLRSFAERDGLGFSLGTMISSPLDDHWTSALSRFTSLPWNAMEVNCGSLSVSLNSDGRVCYNESAIETILSNANVVSRRFLMSGV